MIMSQVWTLFWFSMRAVATRPGACLVLIIGTAGVVTLFCFLFGISEGLASALITAGRDDRALILRGGSETEAASRLKPELISVLMGASGVRLGADGKPMASLEIVRALEFPVSDSSVRLSFPLRGVTAVQAGVRPELRIIEGRMFRAGVYELIVGRAVSKRLGALSVGERIQLRGAPWTITGIFTANGSALESEVLADTGTLQSLFQTALFSSALVPLQSAQTFDEFQRSLLAHPGLDIDVIREQAYFERQAGRSNDTLRSVALIVTCLIALAAAFASINAMHTAMRARLPEIATLRAIGFQRTAVIAAILVESVFFCVIGAAIGAALARLVLQGEIFSTLAGGGTIVQTAFSLQITPAVIGVSGALAVGIGLVGGLMPAIKAGRLQVADALREL
jgi:putative ABC transport system permease protein